LGLNAYWEVFPTRDLYFHSNNRKRLQKPKNLYAKSLDGIKVFLCLLWEVDKKKIKKYNDMRKRGDGKDGA